MKLLPWCKANAMPVIAVLAAAVTAVFVPPDAAYLGYYDVKTLSCLLCVLAVVGALRRVGLFPLLAQRLVQTFHTTRGDGAGVHHAGGFYAADQRHGAADVPAPELVRAGAHRPNEMDGADVHPAKLRRQPGRHADALRQSAEPVPL